MGAGQPVAELFHPLQLAHERDRAGVDQLGQRPAVHKLHDDEEAAVELVAIVTNPLYYQRLYTRAFDRQEHLATLPNWRYLTGTLPELRRVWQQYSVAAEITPAGGMIGHSDVAYVIDAAGRTRRELNFDPGPVDGPISAATRQSVREFEQANKLASTGEVTNGLLRRLRDISGLKVAAIADSPKVMTEGNWRLGVFVDERASDDQFDKLVQVFGGQLGGPMAALAPLIGEMLGVERASIEVDDDGLRHRVRVGDGIEFEIEDIVPFGVETGEPVRFDGMFHPVGSDLTMAEAKSSRIDAFGIRYEGKTGLSKSDFSWAA